MKCTKCGVAILSKWGNPRTILCDYCAGVISLENKRKKGREKIFKDIDKYVHILSKKKKQFSYFDDYGYERINKKKWEAELEHFKKNILKSGRYSDDIKLLLNGLIIERIKYFDKKKKANKHGRQETHKTISNMTGVDYELLCIDYFIKNGWKAFPTEISGDQGADIIATKNGVKLVCQCKRFKGSVGNKAVQEVFAAKGFYEADVAIVLTNSYYTNSAQNLANQVNVKLLTHDDIENICTTTKPIKSIQLATNKKKSLIFENIDFDQPQSNADKFMYDCISIFTKNGWRKNLSIEPTRSNVDVILSNKDSMSLAIKFKYPKRVIGENTVKDIYIDKIKTEADLAVIIARSPYSLAAIEKAKELNIILLHYNDIKEFSLNGML